MQTVTFTGNGLVASATANGHNGLTKIRAYQALFGKIMDKREGTYFASYGVTPDSANDPDGRQDKYDRRIAIAHLSGHSLDTARLSQRMFVTTITNGMVSLTANTLYGVVQAGPAFDRPSENMVRRDLGLARNLSDRKGGRKRSRPKVKKSSRFNRMYWEV